MTMTDTFHMELTSKYFIRYKSPDEIDEKALVKLLKEAVRVDDL